MKHVFVLQNQLKQFLTKSGEWSDGRDANSLYRTEHKDEAINQQFEVSSKDYTLRISLLKCALNDRRNPVIAEEHLPEPMAMPEADAPEVDTQPADAEEAAATAMADEAESSAALEENEAIEPPVAEIEIDASEFEAVAMDMFAVAQAADSAPATEMPEVTAVSDMFAVTETPVAQEEAAPAANDEAPVDAHTGEPADEPMTGIETPAQAEAEPMDESDKQLF